MLAENQTSSSIANDTFAMLDEFRNMVALITSKNSIPDNICSELSKYGLKLTPKEITCYLEQNPISGFEKKMAKHLEESRKINWDGSF